MSEDRTKIENAMKYIKNHINHFKYDREYKLDLACGSPISTTMTKYIFNDDNLDNLIKSYNNHVYVQGIIINIDKISNKESIIDYFNSFLFSMFDSDASQRNSLNSYLIEIFKDDIQTELKKGSNEYDEYNKYLKQYDEHLKKVKALILLETPSNSLEVDVIKKLEKKISKFYPYTELIHLKITDTENYHILSNIFFQYVKRHYKDVDFANVSYLSNEQSSMLQTVINLDKLYNSEDFKKTIENTLKLKEIYEEYSRTKSFSCFELLKFILPTNKLVQDLSEKDFKDFIERCHKNEYETHEKRLKEESLYKTYRDEVEYFIIDARGDVEDSFRRYELIYEYYTNKEDISEEFINNSFIINFIMNFITFNRFSLISYIIMPRKNDTMYNAVYNMNCPSLINTDADPITSNYDYITNYYVSSDILFMIPYRFNVIYYKNAKYFPSHQYHSKFYRVLSMISYIRMLSATFSYDFDMKITYNDLLHSIIRNLTIVKCRNRVGNHNIEYDITNLLRYLRHYDEVSVYVTSNNLIGHDCRELTKYNTKRKTYKEYSSGSISNYIMQFLDVYYILLDETNYKELTTRFIDAVNNEDISEMKNIFDIILPSFKDLLNNHILFNADVDFKVVVMHYIKIIFELTIIDVIDNNEYWLDITNDTNTINNLFACLIEYVSYFNVMRKRDVEHLKELANIYNKIRYIYPSFDTVFKYYLDKLKFELRDSKRLTNALLDFYMNATPAGIREKISVNNIIDILKKHTKIEYKKEYNVLQDRLRELIKSNSKNDSKPIEQRLRIDIDMSSIHLIKDVEYDINVDYVTPLYRQSKITYDYNTKVSTENSIIEFFDKDIIKYDNGIFSYNSWNDLLIKNNEPLEKVHGGSSNKNILYIILIAFFVIIFIVVTICIVMRCCVGCNMCSHPKLNL